MSTGVNEAKQELKRDRSTSILNTLCTHRQSELIVTCFSGATCLLSFGHAFHIMTEKFNSGIFDAIWSTTMHEAFQNNPQMKIADVKELVWAPTFKLCQNVLEQLRNQSITLVDVTKHFECYRWGGLDEELKRLFDGVNVCLSQNHSNRWIRSIVLRIQVYWTLDGYRKAAITFLNLRRTLNLRKSGFKSVIAIDDKVTLVHYVFLCSYYNFHFL